MNWKEVDHSHFEKFVHYTLSKINFRNRDWFGRGGGDKGRDVVAYTYEELPFNMGYERKWIFQCKKWLRFPSTTTLANEVDTASQHSPDFWVLVIPLNPTASQIEFLEFLEKSRPFKIITLPLAAIEEIIYAFPETKNILLTGELPEGSDNSV
ncbi:hypothetical protein [Bacillus sp. B-jedd]|uniref:hypothetical protein n=1 Tax=Bacillus sp. B-jedd TaxID=1476857 RepID=UPI00051570CD|nr:hypothetical protein [Bacillus sp. B-jedd]CEG26024.1 hypothetical protein BN1002_00862 [Bacillus sp. B-jedd]